MIYQESGYYQVNYYMLKALNPSFCWIIGKVILAGAMMAQLGWSSLILQECLSDTWHKHKQLPFLGEIPKQGQLCIPENLFYSLHYWTYWFLDIWYQKRFLKVIKSEKPLIWLISSGDFNATGNNEHALWKIK